MRVVAILRSPWIRWSGLVVLALLLAALVVSAPLEIGKTWRNADDVPCGVALRHGRVWVWKDAMMATPRLGWRCESTGGVRLLWRYEDWDLSIGANTSRLVAFPLWWGLAAIGVPTVLMWQRELRALPSNRRRRRLTRGLCWRCGYDMSGSKDACPECGAASFVTS